MTTRAFNSKSWVFGLLAAAVATQALTQPDASLLQYQGADRYPKLLAAARKEGSLTFYTTIAEKDLVTIVRPFEKKHGIKVDIWRAGTDKVLQRTLSEAALRGRCDPFWLAGNGGAAPRKDSSAGRFATFQGAHSGRSTGAPGMGGDDPVGLGTGLQHEPHQKGGPAPQLPRPARSQVERQARHRGQES